jgi:hypothetical protein
VEEKWGKAFHGTGPSCSRKTRRRWWRREVRVWKVYRDIYDSTRHRLLALPLLYLLHGGGVVPSKSTSLVSEEESGEFGEKSDVSVPNSTQIAYVDGTYNPVGRKWLKAKGKVYIYQVLGK